MTDILPFIVSGIVAGCIYGLCATGLVITYRTSGILNFAHGAIAAVAAYAYYDLRTLQGLPWPVAVFVSAFIVGPLVGVLLERLARVLTPLPTVYQVASTVGLILIVQSVAGLRYGYDYHDIPTYLPTSTFKFSGVIITYGQLIIFGISLVCAGGLYALMRYSRSGVLMRAAVDSPDLLATTGHGPAQVRRRAWIIGSTFAALSGVLLAPLVSLDAVAFILLVVQAFGAAAIGRFRSIPLTYLGGVLVGIIAALSTKYVGQVSWLQGFPASVPFIVLFFVLIFTPKRHLDVLRIHTARTRVPWQPPLRAQVGGAVIGLGVLAFVPLVFDDRITLWTHGLGYVLMFLSLGLLVKTSGQVSLCHLVFGGVGAAAFAHFTGDMHIPWMISLVLAGLTTVPVGAAIAFPAIRLTGIFLALATFGFGIMTEQLFYAQPWFFGVSTQGLLVSRPVGGPFDLEGDTGFYYLVLAIVVVAVIAMVALTRSRMGRLLRGLADSPLALSTHGVDANVARVLAFGISAFFAGVSGALIASNVGVANAASYTTIASLSLLALVIVQPGGIPFYAIFGALAFQVIGGYIHGSSDWLTLLFGLAACSLPFHVAKEHHGRSLYQRLVERLLGSDTAASDLVDPTPRLAHLPVHRESPGLVVRDLTVRFGGVVAVDGLSLASPMGRVTGLIGPNGAGKTTTFNACSGLLRPKTGTIELHGQDVTQLDPASRARLGLGRTFQRIELFDSLTVRENLWLGAEGTLAGRNPLHHVLGSRGDARDLAHSVAEAVERSGVGDLLGQQAGALSTGQRRLVELARCLSGPFDILLLDEPSSGLDPSESEEFGRIVRSVVDEQGVAVLLVEHDMSLVMSICDHIYVLDFGVPIFDGPPGAVAASADVQAAYLGESLEESGEAVPT